MRVFTREKVFVAVVVGPCEWALSNWTAAPVYLLFTSATAEKKVLFWSTHLLYIAPFVQLLTFGKLTKKEDFYLKINEDISIKVVEIFYYSIVGTKISNGSEYNILY